MALRPYNAVIIGQVVDNRMRLKQATIGVGDFRKNSSPAIIMPRYAASTIKKHQRNAGRLIGLR